MPTLSETSFLVHDIQTHLFSAGEVLSVVGLFFAVLGLFNPRLKLKLDLHPYVSRLTAGLFFLGCLIALSGSFVLPFKNLLGINTNSVAGQLLLIPNTLELIGTLIIVISIILFLWLWNKQLPRVNTYNHLNYARRVISMIAANKSLITLVEDLGDSIPSIIHEASKYERQPERLVEDRTSITTSSLAILDALSDQDVCKLMATNCPRTALIILQNLKKYRCAEKRIGHSLVEGLSNASLMNENSILSRERDYEGLGFFKNFTSTLYGDDYFVNKYDTLGAWRSYERENVNKLTIENYCKALAEALSSEKTSGHQIRHGLERLTSPIYHLLKGASEKNWRFDCDEADMLREIFDTLKKSLHELIESLPRSERDDHITLDKNGGYDRFADDSIYGGWAEGLFEVFDHLCWANKENDDFVRTLSISLWMDVFPNEAQPPQLIERIQKRLWLLMKERILANLIEQAYPGLTRLFLNYEGYQLFFSRSSDKKRLLSYFPNHDFLAVFTANYPKTFRTDKEYAQLLLPGDITYQPRNKGFTRKASRRRGQSSVTMKEIKSLLKPSTSKPFNK